MKKVLVLFIVGWMTAAAAWAEEKGDRLAVARGNNQFAVDLYGKLAGDPGNQFFSPYSVSNALGMTALGARGQTQQEMTQVLHLGNDPDKIASGFQALIHELQGASAKRAYQLDVANAIWGQQGMELNPKFLQTTQTQFQAGLYLMDFLKQPEAARLKINRWVEEKTRDKIKDLLPAGSVHSDTRMVLTNAIYFKGDWLAPFEKESTFPQEFRAPSGKFKTPMMHQTRTFAYLGNDDFQMVSLPYKGNELSMVILLPRKDDGLAHLEKFLSAPSLEQNLKQAAPKLVRLALPKFKMTKAIQLGDMLKNMGMRLAFTLGADFSGMVRGSAERLCIDAVIHKAFVAVDEKGTEAAAATAVTIKATAVQVDPVQPEVFTADHPFICMIRHNGTGSILFMGRLVDPR